MLLMILVVNCFSLGGKEIVTGGFTSYQVILQGENDAHNNYNSMNLCNESIILNKNNCPFRKVSAQELSHEIIDIKKDKVRDKLHKNELSNEERREMTVEFMRLVVAGNMSAYQSIKKELNDTLDKLKSNYTNKINVEKLMGLCTESTKQN